MGVKDYLLLKIVVYYYFGISHLYVLQEKVPVLSEKHANFIELSSDVKPIHLSLLLGTTSEPGTPLKYVTNSLPEES
jgi:hypothetical protein